MADFAEEIERFLTSFSSEEIAASRHAFRAILDGRPVRVGELPAVVSLKEWEGENLRPGRMLTVDEAAALGSGAHARDDWRHGSG